MVRRHPGVPTLRGHRGEAAALDGDDLDSRSRELTITRQLIALPGKLYCGPPKSRANCRTIALDEAGARSGPSTSPISSSFSNDEGRIALRLYGQVQNGDAPPGT